MLGFSLTAVTAPPHSRGRGGGDLDWDPVRQDQAEQKSGWRDHKAVMGAEDLLTVVWPHMAVGRIGAGG